MAFSIATSEAQCKKVLITTLQNHFLGHYYKIEQKDGKEFSVNR